jgi:hypothetical protein
MAEIAEEQVAARLEALEREYAELRQAIAILSKEVAGRDVDALIAEIADRPMTEPEMEASFERLDAALDSRV